MPLAAFDPADGLVLLGELACLTAPPAGEAEICDQGLHLALRALKAVRGALFLENGTAGDLKRVAVRGSGAKEIPESLAREVMAAASDFKETSRKGGAFRVAMPLPGPQRAIGALLLEGPERWDESARQFARSLARALSAALCTARKLDESRMQGELLARRNVELETLRELGARIQEKVEDHEILEAALQLVLEKLGLRSGWIFWGESKEGKLELAACQGISEPFVTQAKKTGIGPCLCQDVFNTGKLRVARNTLECPRLPDLLKGEICTSHACIPLKFERGVQGVLNIANRSGQVFSPQELQFLETVGGQICLAVDKARAARAEARRDAESRALGSLVRAIGGSLERERVLAAVGEYARGLLQVDRCAIFLGESPAALSLAYLSGPRLEGLELGKHADFEALKSRAFPEAMRSRAPLVVSNAAEDPRANPELAKRWNVLSALVVPLIAHHRILGLLLATRAAASTWDSGDVELADALARHAAVAMENAGLYQDAQEALFRLQRAQYEMMRAERLAAVGTLASSLAHEVRNPLNSINLQLVLLSRRLERLDDTKRVEMSSYIDSARKEITRLNDLVEEFLSLSTVDRVSLAEVEPSEVVRESLELMTPTAHQLGIAVTLHREGPFSPLRLDREKIKQVLINLIRNAIEAMPQGGTLTVSTRMEDGALFIQIADTGAGIQPGQDVFDFFVTTKKGGTGLGLPIARRIVEAHGGSLSYESRPGRGTVFSVRLGGEGGRP
jgi:signal transduction histidine kinase